MMTTKKPELTIDDVVDSLDRQVSDLDRRFKDDLCEGGSKFAIGYILGSAFHATDVLTRNAWFKVLQKRTGIDDEFVATVLIGG